MSWVARHRGTALLVVTIIVATLLSAWLGTRDEAFGDPLDPENAGPKGARAVAQVLEDHGVEVEVARSAAALESVPLGEAAVVLVTGSGALGPTTADRLLEYAGSSPIVVVEPRAQTVRALGYDDSPVRVDLDEDHEAGCANVMLTGLRIRVDSAVAYDDGASACFRGDGGALFVNADDQVAFLGAGSILANDQITRADNAAAALRLLGRGDRVVWYVPDLADLEPSEQVTVGTLLPRWLQPALWLGGLALLAVVVWRSRRLGPLVTEPLPVAIKAIETTRSRGRLYRRGNDREHAAAALRTAARSRLADRLGLPRGVDEDVLVRAVSARLGRGVDEIGFLIGAHAPPPPTDRDLVDLAGALADLDQRARHTWATTDKRGTTR